VIDLQYIRLMNPNKVVIISAGFEWRIVCDLLMPKFLHNSPVGGWFEHTASLSDEKTETVIFFHGGWGKIDAATSAQFIVDQWKPTVLFNLGTCGGIHGKINKHDTVIAEKTVVYDIYEQMYDADTAIKSYITEIDLTWIKDSVPSEYSFATICSGDKDLSVSDLDLLKSKYNAKVVDWESASIARVAFRNKTKCLILRTVSDLVSDQGPEAYGDNAHHWESASKKIMDSLLSSLPKWISIVNLKLLL